MTNVYFYNKKDFKINNGVFVLGSFESIHNGHKILFEKAKEINDNVVVVLFANPEDLPKNQNNLFEEFEVRVQVLANFGIKNILVLEYDEKLRSIDGQTFIENLIEMGASHFVVGKDHKFGKQALWNSEKLATFFPNTTIVELENIIEKVKISTSILKENVALGEMKFVNHFLVEPYKIIVNLDFNNKFKENSQLVKIARGIYTCNFIFENKKYHGYVHFNFLENENSQLFLFDFPKTENSDILTRKGYIEILEEIRFIISENTNSIWTSDIEKSLEYFKKNLE